MNLGNVAVKLCTLLIQEKLKIGCDVFISFDQVKAHIHTYLQNLEENLLSQEDRTELYLLFVNCFQVTELHCTDIEFG